MNRPHETAAPPASFGPDNVSTAPAPTIDDRPLRRALAGGLATAALVSVLAVAAAPIVGEPVVILALIYLLATVGLGVFTGNTGVLNLGYVAFFGIAAYASSILTMDPALKRIAIPELPSWLMNVKIPFYPALAVAMLVAAAAAFTFGIAIVRLSSISAAIASLGVLVIVHTVLLAASRFTNGASTFYGAESSAVSMTACTILASIGIVIARLFRDTVPGLQLRASREDEFAARSMGVRVARLRMLAWIVSTLYAAAAGVLYAHYIGAFSPKAFYFDLLFLFITMLIVGGATTVLGAVGGAITVTAIVEVLRRLESRLQETVLPDLVGLTQIGLAVLLLVAMVLRSDGLLGRLEIDEWIAARRRK